MRRRNDWTFLIGRTALILGRRPAVAFAGAVVALALVISGRALRDGRPDGRTDWQLIHRDTFDRETPPSVDAEGRGIHPGLLRLWRSVLDEGIHDDGAATFSHFTLRWGGSARDRASVRVDGAPPEGLARLRAWRGEALLEEVATTHDVLLLRSDRWDADRVDPSRESLPIVLEATEARSEADLRERLRDLRDARR